METLGTQNAKIKSLDREFTDQITTAMDIISEKQTVQVQDIQKQFTDDVTTIRVASEEARAAALSAQQIAKEAMEKTNDMKDDIKNPGSSSRPPSEA